MSSVWICDDDEGVRDALAFLLRQHGFAVSGYATGPQLLAALEGAAQPVRGVLLLDVRMEPMSGPQLHRELIARGFAARNPIIFLSGHGDIPLAVELVKQGAFSFVEKPYTDHALVTLIQKALVAEVELQAKAERRAFLAGLLARLTCEQRRLLPLLAAGSLNKTMADARDKSVRTIEVHRARLFDNLGVDSAAEVATLVAEMRGFGLDVDQST